MAYSSLSEPVGDRECTLCKSDDLAVFLSLGPMPPANNFLEGGDLYEEEGFYPLDIYVCRDCSHMGVLPRVDPSELFSDYVYMTGVSDTMLAHLDGLAETLYDRYLEDVDDPFVVDIGSNDGSLLAAFQERGARVLGVEPADDIAAAAEDDGVPTMNEFFDGDTADRIVGEHGSPDLVTATNVFAHIPDLDAVTEGMNTLIGGDGAFVFENAYLVDLLEGTKFDTIYHEHYYYHAVRPLVSYFDRFDMTVVDVERLDIHGGSIRVYVEPGAAARSDRVDELVQLEEDRGLDDIGTYQQFADDVNDIRQDLTALLDRLKSDGNRIVGYGAAAKGNTLLNYCRIGPDHLDYIVDNTPFKQGRYTPGMHIPVKPPDHFRAEHDDIDYVLLLAWNVAEEIMSKEEAFFRTGGEFIIPIPEVRTVDTPP